MAKPVAAFDVDGSLYRSNFTIEMVRQLVRQGSFANKVIDELSDTRMQWEITRDRDTYNQYIDDLISIYVKNLKDLTVDEINTAARQIVKYSRGQVYVYGRNLIKTIAKTHELIAISGSPIEVITLFAKDLGISHVHATTFEVVDGIYTGNVVHVGSHKKDVTLRAFVKKHALTYEKSTGIGDTDSDIPMLDLLEHPIAFNPNKELFEDALKKKWEIVYEQKDMILHLGKSGKFELEGNFGHYRQNGI